MILLGHCFGTICWKFVNYFFLYLRVKKPHRNRLRFRVQICALCWCVGMWWVRVVRHVAKCVYVVCEGLCTWFMSLCVYAVCEHCVCESVCYPGVCVFLYSSVCVRLCNNVCCLCISDCVCLCGVSVCGGTCGSLCEVKLWNELESFSRFSSLPAEHS